MSFKEMSLEISAWYAFVIDWYSGFINKNLSIIFEGREASKVGLCKTQILGRFVSKSGVFKTNVPCLNS